MDGDHLQESLTSWKPVSHDSLHQSLFNKLVFFVGEEVLAAEPIVHDLLLHDSPFLFFVVFGGGEGGVDWVQDKLNEGSVEADFLVGFFVFHDLSVFALLLGFLLPLLSVGIKVVLTPKFGHQLVDILDSEFFGIKSA